MSNYVAPTGYVELDNDCEYSIDLKSTRSRESIDPKQDLAFYFDTYLVPKYGLQNINVNNCASFLKELDMNWTKLTPDLQNKVMDIMVDGILNKDTPFKQALINKLNLNQPPPMVPAPPLMNSFSSFGKPSNKTITYIVVGLVILCIVFLLFSKVKVKSPTVSKFI